MAGWFDIGVNLTDKRLSDPAILDRAQVAGVTHMAITGTSIEESRQAIELARLHPGVLCCTAGIHPHYAKDAAPDYLDQLRALALQPEVVAIGECGLDFNRNFSPPDTQLQVFESQLALAAELNMPVFLHERDAFDEQLVLLKRYRDRIPGGVAHCFTGNAEQMKAYLALDLHIGITGWLCDQKRGNALRDAVPQLPLDKVLLETDAPYLMPKTLKTGSRNNEPANLPHIGQSLADLMGLDVDTLKSSSYLNSLKLFGLDAQESSLAV